MRRSERSICRCPRAAGAIRRGGSPAFAAAAGRVVFTGALRVRGNTVIIDHGAGVFTAYNHLSAINSTEGELVGAGQQIGAIGSTGLAQLTLTHARKYKLRPMLDGLRR